MSTVAPGVEPPPEVVDSRTVRRAVDDLREGFRQHELWLLLGWQDIKQRYRRSMLGPLWITVATAVTAVAMGFLYAELFHIDLQTFLHDALDRWILGDEAFTARLNPDAKSYNTYDQLMRLDEWMSEL